MEGGSNVGESPHQNKHLNGVFGKDLDGFVPFIFIGNLGHSAAIAEELF
jgi:hypothetical protein